MKKFFISLTISVLLLTGNLYGATVTKGLIGEQDISHIDGTATGTFTRDSSTGGTLTLTKVGHSVDALVVYGGGVNYTQATIQSAITAISTRHVKLTLRANPSGGWAISTALAIPANIDIDMPTGSYFTYSGTGAITGLKTATPEMFGANTTPGTTDMATAINRAVQSVTKGDVNLKSQVYAIGTPLVMKSNVIVRGQSIDTTLPTYSSTVSDYYNTTIKLLDGSDCDMVTFGPTIVQAGLVGIGLDGNKANQSVTTLYGIKFTDGSSAMNQSTLENVGVHNVSGYGIYGGIGVRETQLHRVSVLYNRREGIWLHNAIDWTFFRVGSGWNGNSALRMDGVAGTDSGGHRFTDTDFFGPYPTLSNMTVLSDVFDVTEASSCVVQKSNIGGNRFYGGAIQGAQRHGLYVLYDSSTTLVPSGSVYIDVLFNINGRETNNTYDQVRIESSAAGSPVIGQRFIGSKFHGGETGNLPKYAINDQNTTPIDNAGNAVIGCLFDSLYYGTARFNDTVNRRWRIDETSVDYNSTSLVQARPQGYAYRSLADAAAATTLLVSDTFLDVALVATTRTITLPAYTKVPPGKMYVITKSDNTSVPLEIDAPAAETINGVTNIILTKQYSGVMLISTNGGWTAQFFNTGSQHTIPALADSATPSVYGSDVWLTGGTTTITNFANGYHGQIIRIIAEHSVTITDGTNIFLTGSANLSMTATGTLTLIQKVDGKWYQLSASAN